MELGLQNRVAVVTGGASGIGRATAALFAKEGARVALWDVAPSVEKVAQELADETGGAVRGDRVDVTNDESILAARERCETELGPIACLVHAAGKGSGKYGFPFTNLTREDWEESLRVNVMGLVNVAHAVSPGMIDRQSGSIVVMASVAGQIGSQTDPPYSASKAANINFAQCMARDLAEFGVRVNTVCPGMVQTPLNELVWQAWNERQPPEKQMSYQEWGDAKVRNVVPLQRWQTVDDVARMVVFLSSTAAQNITGQTINVDGGYVMHW